MAIENDLESAVARLSAAATAAPESGEAAYYLGLALCRSGSLQAGEFQLWRAAQDPGFAHAARVELGLIALRQGEPAEAARRFGESLECGAHDVRARCMLAAALRRSGRTKEAMAEVSAALKTSPQDRLASMEAYFCAAALGRPRIAGGHLRRLTELVPANSDPWLELGFDYAAAGLREEAAALLGQGVKRSTAVRQCPLAHYAMGYWLEQLGRCEEAAEARAKARQLDPRYVFPHQWEMEAVLKGAIAGESADGPAHYYLGNLLYAKGRREEGLRAWEAAAKHLDGLAVLFRNLGFGFRETMGDLEQAEDWLRRAVGLGPGEPRAYLELGAVLRERNSDPRERLAVLDGAPESVQRRGVMAGEQAVACMAAGEWDRAIALLRTHSFHRWEMEFRMRRIWVDANLGRACERFVGGDMKGAREDAEAALEYPRNLRIGKPPRRRDARPQWCAGVACEAMGDVAAAKAHWEEAAAEEHHHAGTEEAVYRALSLRKLGREEEAKQLLDESLRVMEQCAEMAPDDANAHLALGMVRKACGQVEEAAESLRRALEMNPWLPRARQLLDSEVVV
jgi:tetratricopeptide (TPR) repeat protein